MKILKWLFCKHDWKPQGWSYVQCKNCEVVRDNPSLNDELRRPMWDKYIEIEGRDKVAKMLQERGKFI